MVTAGGGFGRRARTDYVTQAVQIAKQMPGVPIKLLWSREEDMTQGTYHPITQCKLTAALDADNNLTGLRMRISGQSILAGIAPDRLVNGRDPATFQGLNAGGTEGQIGYDIPNIFIDHAMRNPHLTPGFWRGVNNNQNAIYLECFIDEVAHAAGQDPLEFRRKMMKKHPQAPGRAQRRRRARGIGQAAAEGRVPRHRPADGLRQLRRRRRPRSRCRATACSPSTASSAPPTPAMSPTRCWSSGRSPARSCSACRRSSTAAAP